MAWSVRWSERWCLPYQAKQHETASGTGDRPDVVSIIGSATLMCAQTSYPRSWWGLSRRDMRLVAPCWSETISYVVQILVFTAVAHFLVLFCCLCYTTHACHCFPQLHFVWNIIHHVRSSTIWTFDFQLLNHTKWGVQTLVITNYLISAALVYPLGGLDILLWHSGAWSTWLQSLFVCSQVLQHLISVLQMFV